MSALVWETSIVDMCQAWTDASKGGGQYTAPRAAKGSRKYGLLGLFDELHKQPSCLWVFPVSNWWLHNPACSIIYLVHDQMGSTNA